MEPKFIALTNIANPHPSDVCDLEPVYFESGLSNVLNPKTEQVILDNTKLYIVKYIGTLAEVKRQSYNDLIVGKDRISYGTVKDLLLYQNTALQKFGQTISGIVRSKDEIHTGAKRELLSPDIRNEIASYLKPKGGKSRKTKKRKLKKH